MRQKILKILRNNIPPLTLLLVTSHIAGTVTNWYAIYPHYDIIPHFLGGVWVGATILWFLFYYFPNSYLAKKFSLNLVVYTGLSVLIIGVVWELWELYLASCNWLSYTPSPFLNNIKDLLIDALGGFAIAKFIQFSLSKTRSLIS